MSTVRVAEVQLVIENTRAWVGAVREVLGDMGPDSVLPGVEIELLPIPPFWHGACEIQVDRRLQVEHVQHALDIVGRLLDAAGHSLAGRGAEEFDATPRWTEVCQPPHGNE